MHGIRLTRSARDRCHTFLVWATMPLIVFNSRTLVGCGCAGHFESTCHCHCCNGPDGAKKNTNHTGSSCCDSGRSHSCKCCGKSGTVPSSTLAKDAPTSSQSNAIRGHQCHTIAMRIVAPATTTSSQVGGDLVFAAITLDARVLPGARTTAISWHAIAHDTSLPPPDLVVTLQRFVI
jgi:hypothetical protein